MADVVVRVEDLGKRYRIGEGAMAHSLLADALASVLQAPFRRSRRQNTGEPTDFWALRGVSFDVREGEILGIVGRNGAGKSTLLKILSHITEPTTGRVRTRGRIGALIEVGTGFHPDLTGRENIYLNGTLLGMRRSEVDSKFDQIVEFAEIERFLDTPVKRYSSGMYMRLAFSIAAHLEPEILIVDEVLAVGDASFQQKCLGRMHSVAHEGRTVLFVSHNLGAVQMLCTRAIMLRNGEIVAEGSPSSTVATYLAFLQNDSAQEVATRTDRVGKGRLRFTAVDVSHPAGASAAGLATGGPLRISFTVDKDLPGAACVFGIHDSLGYPVAFFDSSLHSKDDRTHAGNQRVFVCEMDELQLMPGRYRIDAAATADGEVQDELEGIAFFDVLRGTLRERPSASDYWGYHSVTLPHRWIVPA